VIRDFKTKESYNTEKEHRKLSEVVNVNSLKSIGSELNLISKYLDSNGKKQKLIIHPKKEINKCRLIPLSKRSKVKSKMKSEDRTREVAKDKIYKKMKSGNRRKYSSSGSVNKIEKRIKIRSNTRTMSLAHKYSKCKTPTS